MSDHFGNISISQPQSKTKSKSPEEKPRKKPTRKLTTPQTSSSGPWILTAICIIFLLLIYAGCGFYLAPKLITSWLPEMVRNKSGTELHIEDIQFNPFTFTLMVGQTDLVDPKSRKHTLVSFQSLQAKLAPISLLRGDFVTKSLNVDNAVFDIVRYKDSTYNFTPFIKSLNTSEHSDIMDFSELPFLFSLNNITVTSAEIKFQDIPNNAHHNIEEIRLTLPNISNFSYESNNYIQPSFSAKINGSPVSLTSQTSYGSSDDKSETPKTELACNVDKLDLSLYFSYLPTNFPFSIKKGAADGILKLSFTPSAKEKKLLVEFNLEVKDLLLENDEKLYSIAIPSTKLEGGVQPITGDTTIKQVVLREPELRVKSGHLPGLFNLLMPKKSEPEATGTITTQKKPGVAIDLLIVDNGTYNSFNTPAGKVLENWESVQFNLKNFKSVRAESDNSQSSFRLVADKSNSHTTLNFQGHLNNDNIPAGEFRLDNIDTHTLLTWLELPSQGNSKGSADVAGVLTYTKNEDQKSLPTVQIKEGNIVFHDLALFHKDSQWYNAPVTRISDFSKTTGNLNLGNIFLNNSSISVNVDRLPPLFSHFNDKNTKLSFKALDVKGELLLSKGNNKNSRLLTFTSLNLQALKPNTSTEHKDRDNLTFKAELQTGSQLQAKGKFHLAPFSVVLSTAFTNLPASKILPWFGRSPFLTQTTGALAGKGTFIFPEVSYNGQLILKNGKFGNKTEPFITWSGFEMKDARINRNPLYIGGSEFILTAPHLIYKRDTGTTHPVTSLVKFIGNQLPDSHEKEKQGVVLSSIELQKFSITDGTIVYKENRTTPSWDADISYFRGHIESIARKNGTRTASPFSFSGNLDSIPFTIAGSVNLFDLTDKGSSLFNIKGYPLPSFHEQLSGQIDIDTSRGDFSITNRSDWNNGIVNEQNQLLFTEVVPNSSDSDSALPLALLTNADRTFELLLNTKHKLTEPTEPLIDTSLTTFRKLMIKAAVSPFLVASGEYSDLAGNEHAVFLPGQIALSGQGRESLTRFSSLLSTHPALGIIVTGSASRKIDGNALLEELDQAEMERVARENDKRRKAYENARVKYTEQLERAKQAEGPDSPIVEQDIPPELLKPFTPVEPEPVVIDSPMLEHLAHERARVIVDFFTDKLALEENRIKIAEQPIIKDNRSEDGNQVNFRLFAVPPKQ